MVRFLALALLLAVLACCNAVTGSAPAGGVHEGEGGKGGGEGGAGGAGGDAGVVVLLFPEPASCSEGSNRICSRIIPDENNPDALTLSTGRGGLGDDPLFVTIPDRDEVAKVDTNERQKLWQVSTQGNAPHALAQALDQTVWVANQGLSGEASGDFSNVVHLDRDGNVVCRAPAPGLARGLGTDPNGDVWVGTLHGARLFKFARNATLGIDEAGFPICAPEGPSDGFPAGFPVEALAVDGRGILWTASTADTTLRLDTIDLTRDYVRHGGPSADVAVDVLGGDVYFGGFAAHRIAADGPYVDPKVYEHDGLGSADHLLLTHDSVPYAANPTGILELDRATLQLVRPLSLPEASTGLAEGPAGELWSAEGDGTLLRLDRSKGVQSRLVVDDRNGLEMAGDPTGVRARVRPVSGTWVQVVERSDPTTWLELNWTQLRPGATVVRATARFGSAREVLQEGPACITSAGPPLDLTGCPGSVGARVAAFSFYLQSARDGSKPTVGDISVSIAP